MKCSICEKDACYMVYHYSNNNRIEFVECRCREHFIIDKKNVRKNRKKINKLRACKK